MVIVKLLGGLGNQMFQYATARSVAHRLGSELLIDASAFDHYDLRRYELDQWAIRARLAGEADLRAAGVSVSEPTFASRVARALGIRPPAHVFREGSFTYDPIILSVKEPVYLDGYFQSERYFCDVESILRQEFMLKEPLDPKNSRIRDLIGEPGQTPVSLHIRRGDYVTNAHTAQYHGVCSLDYYRAAATYVAERVAKPRFFIFSDDLEWSRDNLKIDHEMVLVDANGPDKGPYDMALMMSCRHHVIANSSFSWWGAWLNPQKDKIVVAPQRWFSGASHDTSDLVPGSWVRL